MGSRWFNTAVFTFWLISMSWLVVAKILPPWRGGDAPDYHPVPPPHSQQPPAVCWEIHCDGEPIGWAATKHVRQPDGEGQIRSFVSFRARSLDTIVQGLLGSLRGLVGPMPLGDAGLEIGIKSQMDFDDRGRLSALDTAVQLGKLLGFIELHGTVDGSKMKLAVQVASEWDPDGVRTSSVPYRHEIRLPRGALVADAFSPCPLIRGLYVGQTWTFEAYRPFPPNSPLQVVKADVEGEDVITWNGRSVRTLRVVYRSDAGSGISATRMPFSTWWVRSDGTVLKQEVTLASLRFSFVRLPQESCHEHVGILDEP